jgi:hypothetical protein
MADYHSPTVVQPTIPDRDMTPLERLLLSHILDCELDGDGFYFYSETGPSDGIELPLDELRTALSASDSVPSTAYDYVIERLALAGADDTHIEIDLSGTSWEFILQDIVRRSRTLDHITVVSAFTCTKMRPDGFGGMAVLITADAIKGKSTHDILEDFLAEESVCSTPPNAGSHVLLSLDEASVRREVRVVIESDPAFAALAPEAVTDADIRSACIAVAEHADLAEEQGAARFRAALRAIREAERRCAQIN